MSKRPSIHTATTQSAIGAIAASRDHAKDSKSDIDLTAKSDADESIPHAGEPAKPAKDKPLPKVTLYAHDKVLKAIRLVAVEDGVQAQEILRRAVRDYLAKRGHQFENLAKGE